jgi:hypothetical protein
LFSHARSLSIELRACQPTVHAGHHQKSWH